jgi:arabinogalactan endo-1,4-beta-galactosidase
MIVASVRFRLRPGTSLEEATKVFEASAPRYRAAPGLVTKYYVFGNGKGGGVYIWESRQAAEKMYTAEWKKMIAERYGAEPEIEWLENPVTVDNVNGRVTVTAPQPA